MFYYNTTKLVERTRVSASERGGKKLTRLYRYLITMEEIQVQGSSASNVQTRVTIPYR